MNQNPRGVQTPPRPQMNPQKRPTQGARPQPKKQKMFDVTGKFWATLAVTVVLLVAMLITMTVLLIADSATPPVSEAPSGDTSTTQKPSENGGANVTPRPSEPSTKTGISLPSVTKEATYAVSAEGAKDISTDANIASKAIALIDVTNGRAVASKNGSEKIYPASMTKVMTVLLACEKATDPLALLTVSEEMVARYKSLYKTASDAPSVGIAEWQAGYQITVEDALYLAIYQSDTYACWLLAEHVAGNEEKFAQMMTQRAKEIGCTNTNFANATGLEDSNHYTTAFDMAAIMSAAINNPVANKILTSYDIYSFDIYTNGTKLKAESSYSAWYINRLNKNGYDGTTWYYAGKGSDIRILGGKTGAESHAGSCFVTFGQTTDNNGNLTGNVYVCVQAGATTSKESTYDTREVYQAYAKD